MINYAACRRRHAWLFCFLLVRLQYLGSVAFPSTGQVYRDVFSRLARPVTPNPIHGYNDFSWFQQSSSGLERKRSFRKSPAQLRLTSKNEEGGIKGMLSRLGSNDEMFNIKTTFSLVGGQAALVLVAVAIAAVTGTPNLGFGPDINFGVKSFSYALLMTVPLGVLAWILDQVEDNVPALKEVTVATQRSVLALLGSTFKPGLGLAISIALGLAAGFGEEILFRGVLQYELVSRFGRFAAIGVSSVIFGLLHAVTLMYATLATLASIYFGYLYLESGNLAVPIVTHAVYDIFALFYAHWCVAKLTPQEQKEIAEWVGPSEVDR